MHNAARKKAGKPAIPRAEGVYIFPRDKTVFQSVFWRINDAARYWRVPYHTARRWALLHPESAVWVLVKCRGSRRPRWKLCLWCGIEKGVVPGPGNPLFRDPRFQRSMAERSMAKRAAEAKTRSMVNRAKGALQ